MTSNAPGLVLGSTSPFRKSLLSKLGMGFTTASPDIDETRNDGETPQDLVTRLAVEKARAVASEHPDSLVIGSDQVACNEGHILGKPGNRENAIKQLEAASGKVVTFYTGLCLLNTVSNSTQVSCEPFNVHFRELTRDQIERYLDAEEPYNCAGSFKSEALGITLFDRLEGDDPNSLIGLPLIRLVQFLEKEGVAIP
ncbi:MAG: nucleoside triphosphate pyrophosphatase [Candidatus Sedimenticola sp. 20ELBAFRAG]